MVGAGSTASASGAKGLLARGKPHVRTLPDSAIPGLAAAQVGTLSIWPPDPRMLLTLICGSGSSRARPPRALHQTLCPTWMSHQATRSLYSPPRRVRGLPGGLRVPSPWHCARRIPRGTGASSSASSCPKRPKGNGLLLRAVLPQI